MNPAAPTILFAGGGTGGHLFPGIAIAEAVLERRPDARLRFLCSDRPGDATMLDSQRLAGAPPVYRPLSAKPFGVRPRALLRFLAGWGPSVRQTRAAIREGASHGPVALVALGGFVAAPAVQAARVEKCPVLALNLDAVPGKANRWIARHAGAMLTAAAVDDPIAAGWERIGPIVRQAARAPAGRAECRAALGLDPNRPTLLATGASLGAGTLNRFVAAWSENESALLREEGWQIIHQTGRDETEIGLARETYRRARLDALVEPFFPQMGLAWGAADWAVSRAGAGSVAEAWCNRVPTLFLPYPHHADQHQRLNALPLERAGGSLIATDHADVKANLADAGLVAGMLLREPSRRDAMRAALGAMGPADGAGVAAARVLSRLA
ncbi:MAG: glycosyltransferase [Phycisphaeraceae bacterium]|nr:glycosyltransferase [Phycisphaeraceae bacterium]